MEELLLDFGVHEDFIGHAGDEGGQVDTFAEPLLAHYSVDFCQRDHILALEAFSCAHTGLVLLLEAALAEMLDHGDEDILGVVFLKSEVAIGGIVP